MCGMLFLPDVPVHGVRKLEWWRRQSVKNPRTYFHSFLLGLPLCSVSFIQHQMSRVVIITKRHSTLVLDQWIRFEHSLLDDFIKICGSFEILAALAVVTVIAAAVVNPWDLKTENKHTWTHLISLKSSLSLFFIFFSSEEPFSSLHIRVINNRKFTIFAILQKNKKLILIIYIIKQDIRIYVP